MELENQEKDRLLPLLPVITSPLIYSAFEDKRTNQLLKVAVYSFPFFIFFPFSSDSHTPSQDVLQYAAVAFGMMTLISIGNCIGTALEYDRDMNAALLALFINCFFSSLILWFAVKGSFSAPLGFSCVVLFLFFFCEDKYNIMETILKV